MDRDGGRAHVSSCHPCCCPGGNATGLVGGLRPPAKAEGEWCKIIAALSCTRRSPKRAEACHRPRGAPPLLPARRCKGECLRRCNRKGHLRRGCCLGKDKEKSLLKDGRLNKNMHAAETDSAADCETGIASLEIFILRKMGRNIIWLTPWVVGRD